MPKTRSDILHALESYLPQTTDAMEASHVLKMIDFVRRTPKAFERDHEALGHITAGCLVVSNDFRHVLLNLHGQTKTYINFGGHADGDEDVLATALRELAEEAGIADATCNGHIFDVDVHYIAPHIRQGEMVPPHLHYDVQYLAVVPKDVTFAISHESDDIRWFTLEEALEMHSANLSKDLQMNRLLNKVKALQS